MMTVRTISPSELEKVRRSGREVELIDVRTPAEYRGVHIDFARNVPLHQLDPSMLLAERNHSEDASLYVVCRTGNRARKACEALADAGCPSVVNVEGGTQAWEAAGLPVTRGKETISLERQVRIGAGLLVVLGAALGWLVHPAFVGLSAFVGAGLVFAGITDTCAMGMLLARMPWNRVGGSAGCSVE